MYSPQAQPREKVVTQQRHDARLYNVIATASLFAKKEEQGSERMLFLAKKNGAKRTLLRRGRDDRI